MRKQSLSHWKLKLKTEIKQPLLSLLNLSAPIGGNALQAKGLSYSDLHCFSMQFHGHQDMEQNPKVAIKVPAAI